MHKRKVRNNNKKGITLITLVISIIIMLVLAGIIILISFGDNGLLNMGQRAVTDYSESARKEREEMEIDYGTGIGVANETTPSGNSQNQNFSGDYEDNGVHYTDEQFDGIAISNMTGGEFNISADVEISLENVDYEKTRYMFTTSEEPLGTDARNYLDGKITVPGSTVYKAKPEGEYHIHVLLVEKSGNKQEIISKRTAISQGKKDFDYTGDVQEIQLTPGKYQLEVWGAQGGTSYGGKGGYSSGILTLNQSAFLNVYVGQQGDNGYNTTAFNGGGKGYGSGASTEDGSTNNRGGGGGATDIRINSTSLYARVIVAGGRRWRL